MRVQVASGVLVLALIAACSSSIASKPREVLLRIWDKTHPEFHLPSDLSLPWESKTAAPAIQAPAVAALTPPAPSNAATLSATAIPKPPAPSPADPTILRGTITGRRGAVAVVSNDAGHMQILRRGDCLESRKWRVERIEAESAVLVSTADRQGEPTRRIFLAAPESLSPHH